MSTSLVAFDTETHAITPTNLAPRLVVASVATEQGAALVPREDALRLFAELITSPQHRIAGANIAYDLGVLATEHAAAGEAGILESIFNAIERGRVFDVQIAQALDAIARGHLGLTPDGQPLRNADGKVTKRYSLWTVVKLVLGREDAKANDAYRLAYGELEKIPMDQWPAEALAYPVDDARNTLEVAEHQLGIRGPLQGHRNIDDMTTQTGAALALHLGAMIGLPVDLAAVDALEAKHQAIKAEAVKRFTEEGLLRAKDGSKDTKAVKRRLLLSHGATPCQLPGGAEAHKKCESCDGTLLEIPPSVMRTEKGAVSIGRESLEESPDPVLVDFADLESKMLSTYIPYLRGAQVREGAPPWALPTLHPRPNVLLATGRSSCDGVIQLLPRKGGARECFVAGRCDVTGADLVLISADYSQLELCTWSQMCLWLTGGSKMAESINAGRDVHTEFAASMLGRPYDEVIALVKSGKAKPEAERTAEEDEALRYRQAAKPCNFGFPGGMGAFRFVKAQRNASEPLRVCAAFGEEKCRYVITEKGPVCSRCLEIAEDLRARWLAQWPEADAYFKVIAQIVDETGEIPQLVPDTIRPGGVARYRGGVTFSEAANQNFQGLAAQGFKAALWKVTRACYGMRTPALVGAAPLVAIHDELLCRAYADRGEAAAEQIRALMVDAMQAYVPDVAVKVEAHTMTRWSK